MVSTAHVRPPRKRRVAPGSRLQVPGGRSRAARGAGTGRAAGAQLPEAGGSWAPAQRTGAAAAAPASPPASPGAARPRRQDAARVRGGEAQPAAEREPLLARVLLVSAPPELRHAAATRRRLLGLEGGGWRVVAWERLPPAPRSVVPACALARGAGGSPAGAGGAGDLVAGTHRGSLPWRPRQPPVSGRRSRGAAVAAAAAGARAGGGERENRGCPGRITARRENRLDPHPSTLSHLPQYRSGIRPSHKLKLHPFLPT